MRTPQDLPVDTAAEPLELPPVQAAVSQGTDSDEEALRAACCDTPAAPLLVTTFLFIYVLAPFQLLCPSFTIPLG